MLCISNLYFMFVAGEIHVQLLLARCSCFSRVAAAFRALQLLVARCSCFSRVAAAYRALQLLFARCSCCSHVYTLRLDMLYFRLYALYAGYMHAFRLLVRCASTPCCWCIVAQCSDTTVAQLCHKCMRRSGTCSRRKLLFCLM